MQYLFQWSWIYKFARTAESARFLPKFFSLVHMATGPDDSTFRWVYVHSKFDSTSFLVQMMIFESTFHGGQLFCVLFSFSLCFSSSLTSFRGLSLQSITGTESWGRWGCEGRGYSREEEQEGRKEETAIKPAAIRG